MAQKTEETAHTLDKSVTRAHIVQSAIAGAYIFLVFLAMHSFQSRLAVASLGASAFLVFSFPTARSSQPRLMIGGSCLGAVSGLLCGGMSALFSVFLPFPGYILSCALAVFLSMLLMTALNFGHPPSAALAVAITIDSHPVILSFAGLSCIIVLCVLKWLLKKHLRDL